MFFIYDCNDCIVGNSKGYTKHCHAQMIATRLRHKLWERYDDKVTKCKQHGIPSNTRDRIIYSIEYYPD